MMVFKNEKEMNNTSVCGLGFLKSTKSYVLRLHVDFGWVSLPSGIFEEQPESKKFDLSVGDMLYYLFYHKYIETANLIAGQIIYLGKK